MSSRSRSLTHVVFVVLASMGLTTALNAQLIDILRNKTVIREAGTKVLEFLGHREANKKLDEWLGPDLVGELEQVRRDLDAESGRRVSDRVAVQEQLRVVNSLLATIQEITRQQTLTQTEVANFIARVNSDLKRLDELEQRMSLLERRVDSLHARPEERREPSPPSPQLRSPSDQGERSEGALFDPAVLRGISAYFVGAWVPDHEPPWGFDNITRTFWYRVGEADDHYSNDVTGVQINGRRMRWVAERGRWELPYSELPRSPGVCQFDSRSRGRQWCQWGANAAAFANSSWTDMWPYISPVPSRQPAGEWGTYPAWHRSAAEVYALRPLHVGSYTICYQATRDSVVPAPNCGVCPVNIAPGHDASVVAIIPLSDVHWRSRGLDCSSTRRGVELSQSRVSR